MKKTAINIAVAIVALLFAFVIAEGIARLLLPAPEKIITSVRSTSYSLPPTSPVSKKILSLAEHPDQGGLYRGTPTGRRLNRDRIVTIENHRLSKKRVLIETSHIGYRNPELGEKTGRRILFLGDSVTFQDFLNEDETFVRLIEKKARRENRHWETINAGVGAISLKTELAILLESGLGLEPDVVVLNFYLNDFQESKGVSIIKLPIWMENSRFLYHLVAWSNQQRGKLAITDEKSVAVNIQAWQKEFEQRVLFADGNFNESPAAFNAMVRSSFADFGAVWSAETWNYLYPLFEELKQLSVEHNFKLVIVGFPVYQQVYTEFVDDYPQQQLVRIGKELDIPVLDLLPPLRAEALRLQDTSMYHSQKFYPDLFFDQCHHTEAGSAFIADQIYAFLLN